MKRHIALGINNGCLQFQHDSNEIERNRSTLLLDDLVKGIFNLEVPTGNISEEDGWNLLRQMDAECSRNWSLLSPKGNEAAINPRSCVETQHWNDANAVNEHVLTEIIKITESEKGFDEWIFYYRSDEKLSP